MTNNPDEIRANIEATRKDLGTNVDALADKVTPSKIVGRQTDKIKDAFGSARDHLMGAASDVRDNTAGTLADVAGTAKTKVQGNPLAVGLVVFGAAWLVSSLLPASNAERAAAGRLKDAAEPVVAELTESAKDAAHHLQAPASDALNAVKDAATTAAGNVKDDAASAAADLKDNASGAKDALQETVN